MFDVGALIFKIQTAGAQVFQRDMAQADQAITKVKGSAERAKPALDAQGKATDDVGAKSRKASEEQKKQTQATENQVQAAKTLSLALLASGLAVTALVGLSVAKFTQFDEAMSNVRAATMATAEEQRILGDAALEAGADSAYSATEAAAAQEELAKAGQSTADIVGGSLTGALSLAAAGQLAVARSAEIMATTLKQYGLEADQAAHVSDVLAAGAGKAQGSVDDLALALSYVGPVAAGLGISLEETGGSLAYLASQGILGEKAGTGLRGVLMSLTAPSAIAARTMKEYGIEIFDAEGNMRSLSTVSGILQQSLGGLTEAERSAALGRIFGNEQITTARILYAGGADAIDEWTAAVDDSGYAAEQAAARQDNLAGDIEKLGGAFDTALIKTGSGANDVLRDMVQSLTALVDMYGEAPEPVQATALVLGVLTGAILLSSGAALGLTARFTELRVQLEKNNISMGKTAAIGGAVGLALAGVVTIVAILAQKQAEARAKAEAYATTLEEGTNRVTDATRDMIKENLAARESLLWWEQSSAYDAAERLGISLDLVTDAALGDAAALRELQVEVDAAGAAHRDSQDDYEAYESWVRVLTEAVGGEAGSLKEAARQAAQKQKADEASAESSQTAADAYLEAAAGAEELTNQLSALIDEINEANGVGQDAITANIDYKDALAEVDEQIQKAREGQEGYALTLDTSTEAGRENMSMLVGLAEDAEQAARAQFELDGNTDKYRATLEGSRQALIDRAMDLGYNADQAAALADQIFRIPSETEWEVIAETNRARSAISQFVADASAKTITIGVTTYTKQPGGGLSGQIFNGPRWEADGGVVSFHAGGSVREHHVAQIARAGEWRVWAEPETEGESYIPHAQSKRARSNEIMARTAEILGGVYIPGGASQHAEGSMSMQGTVLPIPGPAQSRETRPVEIADSSIEKLIRGIVHRTRVEARMGEKRTGVNE